jgi:membrane associated rhomboid family serine protease
MKRFVILLASSLIIGLILFAVFYGLVHWGIRESIGVSASGALGGLAAEYLRLLFEKRKRDKMAKI